MRIDLLLRTILLTGALCLVAASCGDDSDDGDAAPAADPGSAETDNEGEADGSEGSGSDDGPADEGPGGDRSGELVGTWNIGAYQMAGATGMADVVGDATISFDGSLATFTTGCGSSSAEYTPFGVYGQSQAIAIDSLSTELQDCAEDIELEHFSIGAAVRATEEFQFDGDTLLLWRDGNVMIEATAG